MKRPLALVGTLAVTVGVLAGTMIAPAVGASSHREAPSISRDPSADNTDFYAFVSPDDFTTVTFVANYIPLEDPAGGPNFFSFGDDVLYSINVDNKGDGQDHIQYQFRFTTTVRNPNTFLYNTGPITGSISDPNSKWNMPQTYSVTRVENGRSTTIADGLFTPPDNIGPRSTPNYPNLAAQAVYTLNGVHGTGKVFAGQRDDPFFVDLGSVFDLLGLRPFNAAHLFPLPAAPGRDNVAGFNTHSIVLQVPITDLTPDHQLPKDAGDSRAIIGAYASASRKHVTVLNTDGTDTEAGNWVQVSRLGHPLINEVIIPLLLKDKWNRQDPENDSSFVGQYLNPEVPGLINLLYPSLPDIKTTGRTDLVTVLLTGVPGLNNPGTGKQADLLRLNMMIPPVDPKDPKPFDRLAVLDGQLAGYPNGRRLGDDVVDIEVRALACGYGTFLATNFGLCNLTGNNTLGDGVDQNDVDFLTSFPYVADPHQGYEVLPIQSAP
jgi:hypothetical protein